MKNTISIFILTALLSCADKKSNKSQNLEFTKAEFKDGKIEKQSKEQSKIVFDTSLISKYDIIDRESSSAKAMSKSLSQYSGKELSNLPNKNSLKLWITVPWDISKKSLKNTFKYIVNEKTNSNENLDEIVIFAYDNKADVGRAYTFGKMVWASYGQIGNVTPDIAESNNRNTYNFNFDIKEKVGNISKADIPTTRELAIYNFIMADKYIGMDDEKKFKMAKEKFNIKTIKKVKHILYKVMAYKTF